MSEGERGQRKVKANAQLRFGTIEIQPRPVLERSWLDPTVGDHLLMKSCIHEFSERRDFFFNFCFFEICLW